MHAWHRLSQCHSLLEGYSGWCLAERQRGRIGTYVVINFIVLADLLWFLTIGELKEGERKTRVTQREELVDVEMRNNYIYISIRYGENGKVAMRMCDWIQLLCTLQKIENRHHKECECDLCARPGSDFYSPVPKELRYAFRQMASVFPCLHENIYYTALCQDMTESSLERWNDLIAPYVNNQEHLPRERILEAEERYNDNSWMGQTMKDFEKGDPAIFHWVSATEEPERADTSLYQMEMQ